MAKRITSLITAAIATGVGATQNLIGKGNVRTYQASLAGTGTISATVKIQGSLDGTHWIDIATLSVSDATPSAAATSTDAYAYVRGNVTAITGTAATADVLLSL